MVELTITELEGRTGLNRRTIHFYVKEGVIKPPSGLGGAARYGEEHLLRLLLIRELQKSHLRLSGVKEALDRMTLEEMRDMARKAGPPSQVWDKDALETWIEGRLPEEMLKEKKPGPAPTPMKSWNFSFLDIAKGKAGPRGEKVMSISSQEPPPRRTVQAKVGIWERIEIVEGVEVLVRADLAPKYRQLLEELAERIRRNS
jgi:DNA-binding transcriptional MerR regulator